MLISSGPSLSGRGHLGTLLVLALVVGPGLERSCGDHEGGSLVSDGLGVVGGGVVAADGDKSVMPAPLKGMLGAAGTSARATMPGRKIWWGNGVFMDSGWQA